MIKLAQKKSLSCNLWVAWASIIAIVGILVGFAFVFRNRKTDSLILNESTDVQTNLVVPNSLPIPPEGLPILVGLSNSGITTVKSG